MQYTIGFIGAGNMGGALIRGVCAAADPAKVLIADMMADKTRALSQATGCAVAEDAAQVARECGIVMLCVKPQVLAETAASIRDILADRPEALVVSIAAGVTLDKLSAMLPGCANPLVRLMPNTPAAIGRGVILTAWGRGVTEEQKGALTALLTPCGSVEPVTEKELDMGSALSGCGPAFVYLFIEALADGAVETGLSREKAQRYAAQTVLGAAAMVLESGQHPGQLKDAVCSPGGTTIAGVAALEDRAFRAAAAAAVKAAYEKNCRLGG